MHTLSVTEQGSRVHLHGRMLEVRRQDEVIHRSRLNEIQQLLLFGQVDVTTHALAGLAHQGVDVVFLTQAGNFRARLSGRRSPQAALRLAQLRRALDPDFCLRTAAAFVTGKITQQRQVLLRAQRRLADEPLALVLGRLRLLVPECKRETDLDRLRGLEGQAAALYFSQFGKLLIPPEFTFSTRSRRPPRDPVNACLSFGYTLLGTTLESELLRRGLDPMIGFFHQPAHNRSSLALDLLEEFRPLIDTLVLRLINRRQLAPTDFEQRGPEPDDLLIGAPPEPEPLQQEQEPPGVYLNALGRRVFLTEYYRRLRERTYYPPRDSSFELRDILREQVQHLARVIEGDEAEYSPFLSG